MKKQDYIALFVSLCLSGCTTTQNHNLEDISKISGRSSKILKKMAENARMEHKIHAADTSYEDELFFERNNNLDYRDSSEIFKNYGELMPGIHANYPKNSSNIRSSWTNLFRRQIIRIKFLHSF